MSSPGARPFEVELHLEVKSYDIDVAGVVSNIVFVRWLEDLRLAILSRYFPLTADIDLVIDLSPEEVRKALDTLTGLGFRPRAPVEPLAFADPATRLQCARSTSSWST